MLGNDLPNMLKVLALRREVSKRSWPRGCAGVRTALLTETSALAFIAQLVLNQPSAIWYLQVKMAPSAYAQRSKIPTRDNPCLISGKGGIVYCTC